MNNPDKMTHAERIAIVRQRDRQHKLISKLQERGLHVPEDGFRLVSDAEADHVRGTAKSALSGQDWTGVSGWEEVVLDLTNWLNSHNQVLLYHQGIIATGAWFADQLSTLHTIWGDLYFYVTDGMHGFLLNQDSESGTEVLRW